MYMEIKGNPTIKGRINPLFNYLETVNANQIWEYMGLRTEIDPTVDFSDQNILVRWLDIDEGFNDKILINSLEEFNSYFKIINND